MSLGLRFAGSSNKEAFTTLLMYAKKFTSLLGKSIAELAGKSTIETSLNVIVLSLAMVGFFIEFQQCVLCIANRRVTTLNI